MTEEPTKQQVLLIPDWIPTRLNSLINLPWQQSYKVKKVDAQTIHLYARMRGIRKAASRRRVSLKLYGWRRGRMGDPDGYWKSLLDGLVQCGLLIDDSQKWCEQGSIVLTRSERTQTEITLEDLPAYAPSPCQALDSDQGDGRDIGVVACDDLKPD